MSYTPFTNLHNQLNSIQNFVRSGVFDDVDAFAAQNAAVRGFSLYNDSIRKNGVTVNTTNDTLGAGTADGFADGQAIRISYSSAPTPLVNTTTYYVRDVASGTLKVALSPGGPAIDITATGSNVNVFTVDPVDGKGGTASDIRNAVITSGALSGLKSWQISSNATSCAGQGYSTRFTLPTAQQNQPLTISFRFSAGSAYTTGDIRCFIIADPDGTPVVIWPSVVNIPGGSGLFSATFISTSASTYALCFHISTDLASTSNWTLTIDDIRVEPKVTLAGMAISDWIAFVPTYAGITLGNGTATGFWRRIGDSIECQIAIKAGSTTSGTSTYKFYQPSSFSIDTNKIASTIINQALGTAYWRDSATSDLFGIVKYDTVNNGFLVLGVKNASGDISYWDNANTPFGTGDELNIHFVAPIQGWSSNIQLVQSATEYAYNTDTTDADNYTSFGYGTAGALFPNRSIGTSVTKRVCFQTPIQPTDTLVVEVYDPTLLKWVEAGYRGFSVIAQGTSWYGIALSWTGGSATPYHVNVVFAHKGDSPTNATYAGNGGPWSDYYAAGWKWRVRKSSGMAVGEQVPISYKESLVSTFTNIGTSGQYFDMTSLTLEPGDWDLTLFTMCGLNGASQTQWRVGIGTESGNSSAGMTSGINTAEVSPPTASVAATATVPSYRVQLATTTTLYAKGYAQYSGGPPQYRCRFCARRLNVSPGI